MLCYVLILFSLRSKFAMVKQNGLHNLQGVGSVRVDCMEQCAVSKKPRAIFRSVSLATNITKT